MKTLKEEVKFRCSADELWMILADVRSCDWGPTLDKSILEGDCRNLEISGMGQITEKILKQDYASMILQYSAIQTPIPIEHHLATMQILPLNDEESILNWTTEISPDTFADAIHQGMLLSIEGLQKIT